MDPRRYMEEDSSLTAGRRALRYWQEMDGWYLVTMPPSSPSPRRRASCRTRRTRTARDTARHSVHHGRDDFARILCGWMGQVAVCYHDWNERWRA